jgi:pre-mRNA-splicing factor CDC5/CEF1
MQYIVAEVSKANDPVAVRMRGVLNMPEPNVTDSELEKIAKMAQEEGMEHKTLALASQGGKATDALLGDYEDRVLPTPMRSNVGGDRTSKQEAIMREASNLRLLERGQTPLLGGENPTLYESSTATSVK